MPEGSSALCQFSSGLTTGFMLSTLPLYANLVATQLLGLPHAEPAAAEPNER
jgi:hypothetical protein